MLWRAYFFNENKDCKQTESEAIPATYGLKLDRIKSLKFLKTKSHFQRILKDHINTIHSKGTTLTFADKTSNLYKIKKEQYFKMLKDSITTTYKKASDNIHNKIKTDRTHEGQRYAK